MLHPTHHNTRGLLFAQFRGLAIDLQKVISDLQHRIDERVNDRARHERGARLAGGGWGGGGRQNRDGDKVEMRISEGGYGI